MWLAEWCFWLYIKFYGIMVLSMISMVSMVLLWYRYCNKWGYVTPPFDSYSFLNYQPVPFFSYQATKNLMSILVSSHFSLQYKNICILMTVHYYLVNFVIYSKILLLEKYQCWFKMLLNGTDKIEIWSVLWCCLLSPCNFF